MWRRILAQAELVNLLFWGKSWRRSGRLRDQRLQKNKFRVGGAIRILLRTSPASWFVFFCSIFGIILPPVHFTMVFPNTPMTSATSGFNIGLQIVRKITASDNKMKYWEAPTNMTLWVCLLRDEERQRKIERERLRETERDWERQKETDCILPSIILSVILSIILGHRESERDRESTWDEEREL